MNQHNFDQPMRQEPLGVIIIFLNNLKKWSRVILVFAIPYVTGTDHRISFISFLGISFFLIVAWSYLGWKNFFFHLAEGNFIINEGIFRKEQTLIPLDRIQSVQLRQNLIQQLLQLTSIVIDTAGSGKKEVTISALTQRYAETLKKQLLSPKNEPETLERVAEAPMEDGPLIQFTMRDIFRVGLTENHFKGAFMIVGLFGYFTQYSEYMGMEDDTLWDETFNYIWTILPIFLLVFILISVIFSLWRTFLRYYNLSVTVKKEGVSVKSGLFKIEESFVPLQKIQFIKWQSNPLRKLIGYKSLAIYQASPLEVNRKKAVNIPGCNATHQAIINHRFYPDINSDQEQYELKPERYWTARLLIIFVGFPALLAGIIYYFMDPMIAILPGLFTVMAPFFVIRYASSFKVIIGDKWLKIQRGYVFTETTLVEIHKIQNTAIKQSIFQKRGHLVSLKLYTASGCLRIPYINESLGYALCNKLLYQIESSKQSWM